MRWIGFSAADFVEFFLALVFVALASRSRMEPAVRWLARRPAFAMAFLAVLPIALRLALLAHNPIPAPIVSDDFSYVLIADTLRHFRLANPAHLMHRFFETFFVLQEPAYASIFPLGQGLMLAIGWTLFGHPWAGVALSIGALCALVYWMLRAWVAPEWAFVGGLLAAVQFGPLNQWMNSYWGGAVAAGAGCLAFGALPRLQATPRALYGVLLGLGIGLHWLTRPFETTFVVLSVAVFLLPQWRSLARPAIAAGLVLMPALALSLIQNKAITGQWTMTPYQLSQYQYGVPTTFTLQPVPTPHRPLTREQQLDYDQQSAVHGPGTDTFARYWRRWVSRLRFYRFFFLAPLYLAIPAFLLRLRESAQRESAQRGTRSLSDEDNRGPRRCSRRLLRWHFVWVLLTILLFSLGTNFYPYFYSHYIAATTCLFVLIGVVGLERLSQWNPQAARILLLLCAAHFAFWYAMHLANNTDFARFESWNAINQRDPEGRIAIRRRLESAPGRQLVFVRYGPQHDFQEWVHNAADIDGARIVWARDLGADENPKLLGYYPDRKAWLLEPDAHPPRLTPYPR